MNRWHVRQADPEGAEAVALIAAHDAHGAEHYPAESNHNLGGAALAAANAQFYVAEETSGVPIGMGAFVALSNPSGAVEIKSMFVADKVRGQGVASTILDHLVRMARQQGFTYAFLETGSKEASAAARALYESRGFVYCDPFGDYTLDPESVFMTRKLA